MKKIYKIKKSRGSITSIKALSLICLIGSAAFTMNYINHKNYLMNQQNYTYSINQSGQQIFFDTNMLNSGSINQSYIDDLIANQSNLSNNLNFLNIPDSSLLSFFNSNNLSDSDIEQLKNNVNKINVLANDLNNVKDSYSDFLDNKKDFPVLINTIKNDIKSMQNNSFYNDDTKKLLNSLNYSLNNINIFNEGNLFYSHSELLKYQMEWSNNLNNLSNNLNNTLNIYMGTRVSAEISDLNDKVKNLTGITNDFIKINQFKDKYNSDKLNTLNNNFNNTLNLLLNKQKNMINVPNISFYIAIGLLIISILSIVSSLINKEILYSAGNNKKDKKQLYRYKESLKKLESLLKTILIDREKNISKTAYDQTLLNNTTKDVTTFNLRTTIDKIFVIFFNIIDNNRKSFEFIEDYSRKTNKKLKEMEEEAIKTQINKKNREAETLGLLNQQIKSANSIKSVVFTSDNIYKKSLDMSGAIENIIKKMKSIREISQDISKRIKRMSESSQGVGENTDYIREFSRKIEVLALDVGINASSLSNANVGEGRKFSIIAKEIQRLAKYTTNNANKIDEYINTIKEDAKKTVSEMEENTSHIVESDNSINKISKSLNLIIANMVQIKEESEKVSINFEANKAGVQATKELLGSFQDFIQTTTYFLEDLKTQVNVELVNETTNALNEINQKVNKSINLNE